MKPLNQENKDFTKLKPIPKLIKKPAEYKDPVRHPKVVLGYENLFKKRFVDMKEPLLMDLTKKLIELVGDE